MVGLLMGTLFLCLFFTVPIFVSLAISTVVTFAFYFPGMGDMLTQAMVSSMDSFPLMAIPFFMLVGSLMEKTSIADKLVDVAKALTGDSPGGLGAAAVIASMLFAAISGSGPATAAAIGGIMIPAMMKQGYEGKYCGALIGSASTIGPVIPPSISMITYGVTIGVSVTTMFTAGFLPGFMMGGALILWNKLVSHKRGYRGEVIAKGWGEKMKIMKSAIWALLMPILVLGGIYAGLFTPTESAVIGVIYSLLVGKFAYHTLNWKLYKEALVEAAITSATIMILFGGASTFGRLLTLGKIPETVSNAVLSFTRSPLVIMLIINVILLIAGMFIDTNSCIILFAPFCVPLLTSVGYNDIYVGVIMVVNLCIGMVTPPLGPDLFIAQRIAGCELEETLPEALPQIAILLAALAIMIFCPDLVLFIPRLFGMIA